MSWVSCFYAFIVRLTHHCRSAYRIARCVRVRRSFNQTYNRVANFRFGSRRWSGWRRRRQRQRQLTMRYVAEIRSLQITDISTWKIDRYPLHACILLAKFDSHADKHVRRFVQTSRLTEDDDDVSGDGDGDGDSDTEKRKEIRFDSYIYTYEHRAIRLNWKFIHFCCCFFSPLFCFGRKESTTEIKNQLLLLILCICPVSLMALNIVNSYIYACVSMCVVLYTYI